MDTFVVLILVVFLCEWNVNVYIKKHLCLEIGVTTYISQIWQYYFLHVLLGLTQNKAINKNGDKFHILWENISHVTDVKINEDTFVNLEMRYELDQRLIQRSR